MVRLSDSEFVNVVLEESLNNISSIEHKDILKEYMDKLINENNQFNKKYSSIEFNRFIENANLNMSKHRKVLAVISSI